MRQQDKVAFIGLKGMPPEFVGTSGVEFYVEKKAAELFSRGQQVVCYVRNWATPPGRLDHRGIALVRLPSLNTKHLDAFTHSLLATVHACFTDVDTIWYQTIGPAFFSPIPRLFGKKIITTIHSLDWQREKWGWLAKLFLRVSEKIAVLFSDDIFVVSDDLKLYVRKKYHRLSYVDSLEIRSGKPLKPSIITKKYGLYGKDYILFLGRFVPEKRIDWLIRAYQRLKVSRTKLVLAGGSSHSNDYERRLRSLSKNSPAIIFTGYVFGNEKNELLNNCALFALPSRVEGNPIVIKELSRKVPCLVGDMHTYDHAKNVHYFKTNSFEDFFRHLGATLNIRSHLIYRGSQQ